MNEKEQVKNIFAFLSILFDGKDECLKEIMNFHPEYLIEKFNRYVLSTRPESDWGLHPSLRKSIFDPYCEKWNLPITSYL